jgi:putative transcriptional regulator
MREAARGIKAGLQEAVAYMQGERTGMRVTVVPVCIPNRIDVKAIRRHLGMSQKDFALRFGFSVKSIKNWEQGIRQPEGPARAYLRVIDRKPKEVQEALAA